MCARWVRIFRRVEPRLHAGASPVRPRASAPAREGAAPPGACSFVCAPGSVAFHGESARRGASVLRRSPEPDAFADGFGESFQHLAVLVEHCIDAVEALLDAGVDLAE